MRSKSTHVGLLERRTRYHEIKGFSRIKTKRLSAKLNGNAEDVFLKLTNTNRSRISIESIKIHGNETLEALIEYLNVCREPRLFYDDVGLK